MASLLEEFVGIVTALNERGIDYAICGGWAMAIHGFLRATTDIDILILAKDLETVKEIALQNGFDIEGLSLDFDGGKTMIRRVSKIDVATKTLITLDMILATKNYEKAWRGRRLVKWNKGEYAVVDTIGMIEMKEKAGRPKDLIDLEYLRNSDNES